MKRLSGYLLLAFLFLSFSGLSQSKKEQKALARQLALADLVHSKHFVFNAIGIVSATIVSQQLSSSYFLKLTKDTIYSQLPYFGNRSNPGLSQTESPLDFTTTNFTYETQAGDKGSWLIGIKVTLQNGTDVQTMQFNINNASHANLTISSPNRQQVSFYGSIDKE